jgi:hypothetical protein
MDFVGGALGMDCDVEEEEDDVDVVGFYCEVRRAKVDRSLDQSNERTDWEEHVAAKERAGEWLKYYHMPIETFNRLHLQLFPDTPEARRSQQQGSNSSPMGHVDTRVKLACCLRELFGEKRKSMVDIFLLAPTTVAESFKDVLNRINTCSALEHDIFDTDHTVPVLAIRAFEFAKRSAYPNVFKHVVGAIDGLFIKTRQPTVKDVGNVRTFYSGHKRGFGINMQGVCDASCRFVGFSCNTPGSTSDYVAFRHANFYGHWPKLPEPYMYLGDCAYPLAPFCLTPYVGTVLPESEDVFNFYHSQLRITVERAFGIFVNVFGIFHAPLAFKIANCCDVVEACVRLHNLRINEGCQVVSRQSSNGAVFIQAFDRSKEVFDVLDDTRYVTDRPHATDAAYAAHVAQAEQHSGLSPEDAGKGKDKRDVIALALRLVGAQRPVALPRSGVE